MDMDLNKLWEIVKVRGAWGAAVHGLQRVRRGIVTEQQRQMPDWSAKQSTSTRGLPPPPQIKVSFAGLLHAACQAEVSGAAVLPWELESQELGARHLHPAPCWQVTLD